MTHYHAAAAQGKAAIIDNESFEIYRPLYKAEFVLSEKMAVEAQQMWGKAFAAMQAIPGHVRIAYLFQPKFKKP